MEPTLAEIRLFAGNFAPRGWAFCSGQLLPITQNQSLYSLLGTIYGGDGRSTFALPDLRGRVPVGAGQGPGLSNHAQGAKGGAQDNTLTTANLPSHNHAVTVGDIFTLPVGTTSDSDSPTDAYPGKTSGKNAYSQANPDATMAAMDTQLTAELQNTGNGISFSNIQPSLGLNYIIALQGIFPSRN